MFERERSPRKSKNEVAQIKQGLCRFSFGFWFTDFCLWFADYAELTDTFNYLRYGINATDVIKAVSYHPHVWALCFSTKPHRYCALKSQICFKCLLLLQMTIAELSQVFIRSHF